MPVGDHREQLALLDTLAERLAAGKAVPRYRARELREFYDGVRINELLLRTPDEVDVVRRTSGCSPRRVPCASTWRNSGIRPGSRRPLRARRSSPPSQCWRSS